MAFGTDSVARGAMLALGVLAATGAAAGEDGAPHELVTLEGAVEMALAANPNLRAAGSRVHRAVERTGSLSSALRVGLRP